jgi:hypothetical protein
MVRWRGALVVLARVLTKVLQGGWGDAAAEWKIHTGSNPSVHKDVAGTQVLAAPFGIDPIVDFLSLKMMHSATHPRG